MAYQNKKYDEWCSGGKTSDIITVFTPTYNRASLIYRLYDCLLKQTDKRFVWIVVNDGSKDNTDEVVRAIVDKNEIPILFISKPNGGKHSAFEAAFIVAKTEFFMCMDDDDFYSSESIATFLREWSNIKIAGKINEIGAIRTLTQEEDGSIVSRTPFKSSLLGTRIDQTTLESNYVHHEGFENWTCYRMEALRRIDLFPKNYWMKEQHRFFSEGIWQGRFARKYKCRYYFVVLREYRHDTETSIIRSTKSRQHYVDMFINTKIILDEQLDYILKSPRLFVQNVAIVSILRHKLGIPIVCLLHHTESAFLKTLYVLASPIACLALNPKIQNEDVAYK